ncbi:MAG: mannonate dehydratase [Flavobacteriaceae bacterium]
MKRMHQTMRWYGPHDIIQLTNLKQCGIESIVTALHHIPVGNVWTVGEIKKRQTIIEESGLKWTVVESLPVHDDIKLAKGNYLTYIENYKRSLENLAECGIYTVTYNFMPLLDWVRTNVKYQNKDGSKALLFDKIAFIFFDVFLLKRPLAENSYTKQELEKAQSYGNNLTELEKNALFESVLLGLPGNTKSFTPKEVLALLKAYKNIDGSHLREHLINFLNEIAPLANTLGVKLAIHPDDPPFPILGLPRVVSKTSDLKVIFDAVPISSNGLCFCTGSLGAEPNNNLIDIIDLFENRIHFLHLRNIIRENEFVFRESEHLIGDNPMEKIMVKLINLMQKRNISLPMRPDHGFLHSFEKKELFPGYSLLGRLKGLAELRGLEAGILHFLEKD